MDAGRPKQVNLRRATSTAYYALFHCLARQAADRFIGGAGSDRSSPAWRQTYRALEHRVAKNNMKRDDVMDRFPPGIQDFANTFIRLQDKRHRADYDPLEDFRKTAVLTDIAECHAVIDGFQGSRVKDRRAFAALFKHR